MSIRICTFCRLDRMPYLFSAVKDHFANSRRLHMSFSFLLMNCSGLFIKPCRREIILLGRFGKKYDQNLIHFKDWVRLWCAFSHFVPLLAFFIRITKLRLENVSRTSILYQAEINHIMFSFSSRSACSKMTVCKTGCRNQNLPKTTFSPVCNWIYCFWWFFQSCGAYRNTIGGRMRKFILRELGFCSLLLLQTSIVMAHAIYTEKITLYAHIWMYNVHRTYYILHNVRINISMEFEFVRWAQGNIAIELVFHLTPDFHIITTYHDEANSK